MDGWSGVGWNGQSVDSATNWSILHAPISFVAVLEGFLQCKYNGSFENAAVSWEIRLDGVQESHHIFIHQSDIGYDVPQTFGKHLAVQEGCEDSVC